MSKDYDALFPNNYVKNPRTMIVDFANAQITMQVQVSLISNNYPISMDERRLNPQNCKPEEIIDDLLSIIDGEAAKEKPKIVKYVQENIKDEKGNPLQGEMFNKAVAQRLDIFKGEIYNKKKFEAINSLLVQLSETEFFKKLIELMK